MSIVVALLILWIICIVLGSIFKALAWLLLVGVTLFMVTLAFGVIREVTNRRPRG